MHLPSVGSTAPNEELIAIVDAHHMFLVRTHRHRAHRVHRLVMLQYLQKRYVCEHSCATKKKEKVTKTYTRASNGQFHHTCACISSETHDSCIYTRLKVNIQKWGALLRLALQRALAFHTLQCVPRRSTKEVSISTLDANILTSKHSSCA